jgi:hypothetical protein
MIERAFGFKIFGTLREYARQKLLISRSAVEERPFMAA